MLKSTIYNTELATVKTMLHFIKYLIERCLKIINIEMAFHGVIRRSGIMRTRNSSFYFIYPGTIRPSLV